MNNIFKVATRFNGLRSLINPVKNISASCANPHGQRARSLWCMSKSYSNKIGGIEHSQLCSCGCGNKRLAHSKGESELVQFLTEEVLAERKAQKIKTIPSELDGFKASLNGAEVTLTKNTEGECIKITFNVNHTVDTDPDEEPKLHENMDKPDIGELKSKPAFKVELIRGDTTVSLLCSFMNPNDQDEGYNDVFGIDEISIYNGEWNENVYAVSGEVVDSYLYDLMLNYLEEKGISNEFVEKLSDYSTAYEHTAYIGLLEGLSKFVSGK
ncbi:complement C1q binding protein P32 [Leptinotarsa decemlineata]|uniref:complement C1q binding protein P32 n=1 Tax=Leptinotarsa decemlineata TaxID=7539 RepID=UPI000C2546C6|nr:complement component 1 Q subcomponent-binding protein, mitochondrial [Leptinotarsa decemlineata]